MTRRAVPAEIDPGQIDLFGGSLGEAAAIPVVPPQEVKSGFGGKPDVVAEALVEIRDQRYGRMDFNDRIVCIEYGERCRYAPDGVAEVVEAFSSSDMCDSAR